MQFNTISIHIIFGLLFSSKQVTPVLIYGNLSSVILFTLPYHFVFCMKSIIEFWTFIFSIIALFCILSLLEILSERLQKPFAIEFNLFFFILTPMFLLHMFLYFLQYCIKNLSFIVELMLRSH